MFSPQRVLFAMMSFGVCVAFASTNPFVCEPHLLSKKLSLPSLKASLLLNEPSIEEQVSDDDPLTHMAKNLLREERKNQSTNDRLLYNMEAAFTLASSRNEKLMLLKHYWAIIEKENKFNPDDLVRFGLLLIDSGETKDGLNIVAFAINSVFDRGLEAKIWQTAKLVLSSNHSQVISVFIKKVQEVVKTQEAKLRIWKKADLSRLTLSELKNRNWNFNNYLKLNSLGLYLSNAAKLFQDRGETKQAKYLRKLTQKVYRLSIEAGLYQRDLNGHLAAKEFRTTWDSHSESFDELFWRLRALPNFNPEFDGLYTWQYLLIQTLEQDLARDPLFFRYGLKYLEELGPNLRTLDIYKTFSDHFPADASAGEVRDFIQRWSQAIDQTAEKLKNYQMFEESSILMHSRTYAHLTSIYPEVTDSSRWAKGEDSHLVQEKRMEQVALLFKRPEDELNSVGWQLLSHQLSHLDKIPPFRFNPYIELIPFRGPQGFMERSSSGVLHVAPFLTTSLFKIQALSKLIPIAKDSEREKLLDQIFHEANSLTLVPPSDSQIGMAHTLASLETIYSFEAARLLFHYHRATEGDKIWKRLASYLEQNAKSKQTSLDPDMEFSSWLAHVKLYLHAASIIAHGDDASKSDDLKRETLQIIDENPGNLLLYTLSETASLLSTHQPTIAQSAEMFHSAIKYFRHYGKNLSWDHVQIVLKSLASSQLSDLEKDRLTCAVIDELDETFMKKTLELFGEPLQFLINQETKEGSLFTLA